MVREYESVRLYIFLPVAVILLWLWASGLYLLVLPGLVKGRRKTAGTPPNPPASS